MPTQYYAASSLDGFIAGPDDNPNDNLEWLLALGMPAKSTYDAFFARIGAIAMGSATYRWVLRHLVAADKPGEQPWPYPVPTWVFTSRPGLDIPGGADVRFVSGDVRPVHAEMARRTTADRPNLWICGGGELAGQFLDAGLLDELIIQVTSLTLGRGAPLLPRDLTGKPLELLSAEMLDANFAELRYRVRTL